MTSPGSVNIATRLSEAARSAPDAPALIFQRGRSYERVTFAELDLESDRVARGLLQAGLSRGSRTVVMVKPCRELFSITFGLFKLCAVPVLVDPGLGLRRLGRSIEEAAPEAFIGIPRAHAARIVLGWGRRTVRTAVTVGPRFPGGGSTLAGLLRRGGGEGPFEPAAAGEDDVAAILFTSGSTGPPKGAVYTHGTFRAQVEMLRELYGIRPGERDISTFPLFALFGPALGMTSIVPDMNAARPARADPRKLAAAIIDCQATSLFGSPALVDRLGSHGEERGWRFPSLRRVISAGAPVRTRVLERMAKLLSPGVEVHTPYGATECLPVASIGSGEVLRETRAATAAGKGVCVGRPALGIEVRVIRIDDGPIDAWSDDLLVPAGEIGELVVQGPIVTRSYHNREAETRLAKISDPRTGSFWHRMGDIGFLDGSGRVWMCGRKSQRVIAASGTLFTVPCEGVFNAHPEVRRSALVGVGPRGGARPVLCVECERPLGRRGKARLREEILELGARHEITRPIRDVIFVRSFPVDIRHNAKIFRERLARTAARRIP